MMMPGTIKITVNKRRYLVVILFEIGKFTLCPLFFVCYPINVSVIIRIKSIADITRDRVF